MRYEKFVKIICVRKEKNWKSLRNMGWNREWKTEPGIFSIEDFKKCVHEFVSLNISVNDCQTQYPSRQFVYKKVLKHWKTGRSKTTSEYISDQQSIFQN